MKTFIFDDMAFQVVYSPDDGGYYAEIWHRETGKDAHTTQVFGTAGAAKTAAFDWLKKKPHPAQ